MQQYSQCWSIWGNIGHYWSIFLFDLCIVKLDYEQSFFCSVIVGWEKQANACKSRLHFHALFACLSISRKYLEVGVLFLSTPKFWFLMWGRTPSLPQGRWEAACSGVGMIVTNNLSQQVSVGNYHQREKLYKLSRTNISKPTWNFTEEEILGQISWTLLNGLLVVYGET